MTPLAHRITKELTLPIKDRTFRDQCGLLTKMGDIHCFEVSEVIAMARELSFDMLEKNVWEKQRTFLPAPKTWVEWRDGAVRLGLLIEQASKHHAVVWAAGAGGSGTQSFDIYIGEGAAMNVDPRATGNIDHHLPRYIHALLAIINTPRMIGRRTHHPHRALERSLLKQRKVLGHFPLNAWTEVKLEATPTYVDEAGVEREARLSGRKCLHFVRAHLRVKMGRLELVSAHWRGDGSLGIKQTRYKLAA